MQTNTQIKQQSEQNIEQIWQEFKKLGSLSLKYKRKAQFLIPTLSESKIYLRHGFATLQEAASKLAGINSDTVRKILSVHYRTENFPKLREVVKTQGYAKVDSVLVLAKSLPEESLVKMTTNLPRKTLRQKVKEIKVDLGLERYETGEKAGSGYQKDYKFSTNTSINNSTNVKFSVEADDNLQQGLNRVKYKLEKEKGHPVTNRELLMHLVGLAESNRDKVDSANDSTNKGEKSKQKTGEAGDNKQLISKSDEYPRAKTNKTLTPKHKVFVKQQNNGICYAKNCNKVATEVHHVDYQSLYSSSDSGNSNNTNNSHNLDNISSLNDLSKMPIRKSKHANLRALCKIHHQLEHFSGNFFDSETSFSGSDIGNEKSIKIAIKSHAKQWVDAKVRSHWHLA